MTANTAGSLIGETASDGGFGGRLGAYLWSDSARRLQTTLGVIWLLDGGLQFQSFMYSRGFLRMIDAGAAGQPAWLASLLHWGVRMANGDLAVWNSLFALVQVAIGLGLLYRPLVKPALIVSFAWSLFVWGFGEAFGMLFMNMAQPLTGAPGAVLLYGLIGLLAWPNGRQGGLLGVRGAKVLWCALWSVMAYLWLLAPNSSPDATHDALTSVSSGIAGLTSVQHTLARASAGHGLLIALVLGAVSLVIAIGVVAEWRPRTWLSLSIALNLGYWVLGQSLGGIFAGGATDPNAGPLFVVLACAVFPLFTRG
ncbi:MAG TPA: hypothetical protein VGL69_01950 [Solirubrobacteraceae bacterium]|jgi:hypothetical protein